MAKYIERISQHSDDPGLLFWFVEGTRFGPVRRDYAAKVGIEAGASWTQKKSRQFEHLQQLQSCHEAALKFLAKRDFTKALLLQRLSRKWPAEIAQMTVDQMCAAGWVNDHSYAKRRAASVSQRKIISADLLQAQLTDEGVPERVAHGAARVAATNISQLATEARRLFHAGKTANRIAQKFARAGFDLDTIQTVLNKAKITWDPET